jgi:hypothetical protein
MGRDVLIVTAVGKILLDHLPLFARIDLEL